MTDILNVATCAACGELLREVEPKPGEVPDICANCGYQGWVIGPATEGRGPPVMVRFKGQSKGSTRPLSRPDREGRHGAEWSVTLKRWVRKERYIDREHNLYEELVYDFESSTVLKHTKEPLVKHVGHGSDKE